MRKLQIFSLAAILLACSFLSAQNVRYSAPFPSVSSATSTPYLVANVPPNSPVLAVCHSPANQVPCTNYATTYTSAGAACSNGAQDTPDPQPSNCQSIGDAQGNIGFWAPPGQYDYTVCIQNSATCLGPYTVTLGTITGVSASATGGAPNVGDCLLYNTYGDSAFDLASCPPHFIQVIGDGADNVFALGTNQNAQTIGTFSVFPATATDPGGNTYSAAATASTNDVLDIDQGFGVSTGGQQASFGTMRRYSVRIKLNNSANVGYWWGLANGSPQFGTNGYSTLTPNLAYCMFRYRAGTDTTIKAACGTSSASQTVVDTTVALDTTASHLYDIVNVGGTSTSFRFLIDGVVRATISATLPAAATNYGTLVVGDNLNTNTAISFVFFYSTLVLK